MLSEHLPKGIPYRKFEPLLLSDDCVSYPSILLVSYTTVLLVYEHVHRFFFFFLELPRYYLLEGKQGERFLSVAHSCQF